MTIEAIYEMASIVQHIPDFFDISSYTWLLYFISTISLCVIWWRFCSSSDQPIIKFLLLLSMSFYIFLNPQYTVTAFYCAIAGYLCLLFPKSSDYSWPRLFVASIMLLFSFLIREKALAGALLLASVFIPWRMLYACHKARIGLISLIIVMLGVHFLDGALKNGEQWTEIKQWQVLREKLADRQYAAMFLEQPQVHARHGISRNDLDLVKIHFGGDPKLRKNDLYEILEKETGTLFYIEFCLKKIKQTFSYLLHYPLFLFVLIFFLLFIVRFNGRTVLLVGMFLLSLLLISIFSRGGPNVARVYYPILFLAIAMLLLIPQNHNLLTNFGIKKIIIIFNGAAKCVLNGKIVAGIFISFLLLLSIIGFSINNLLEQWQNSYINIDKSREYLDGTIWWGYHYPLSLIYSPFTKVSDMEHIRFQNCNWPILDPETVKFFNPFDPDSFKILL